MNILELLGPNIAQAYLDAVDPAKARERAYRDALKRFDFWGEAIDDGRAYRTWRATLDVLKAEQRAIDPSGEIWLSIMPARTEAGPQPPLPEVV